MFRKDRSEVFSHHTYLAMEKLISENKNLKEVVVVLANELKKHWTHPTNPCLCSICQVFSRFKKQIEDAENSELERIKNTIA